jgi:hypothetical protein
MKIMNACNNLECMSLTGLSSLASKARAYPSEVQVLYSRVGFKFKHLPRKTVAYLIATKFF